jgi:hypothetical protein
VSNQFLQFLARVGLFVLFCLLQKNLNQLAISEALICKKMNLSHTAHLFLDAGGSIDDIDQINVLEKDTLAPRSNFLVEVRSISRFCFIGLRIPRLPVDNIFYAYCCSLSRTLFNE